MAKRLLTAQRVLKVKMEKWLSCISKFGTKHNLSNLGELIIPIALNCKE
jgi:hypothetical protein